ncbi:hypothetical protein VOLCADRAFT_97715 [Volvox carteri f. nagariensis]|uniref:Uncharacterized protein n=1 Tax=Volvox carteri f. nagariensis TaxID=3068 RepID=D8UDG5_VOLCA|nr:uncharacterized protein VOLCADRAFT_97715 [Volvox carteri f. nagariensis]EFJ42259.1 hypothetical protein VOLCADRAFT_97715 [Volvox carteri f. nagariensis]|eukprot:XP_002956657.1 hypothetical protein VOLCADRAFT_97715 [Volvox carteri f. nagariensis]
MFGETAIGYQAEDMDVGNSPCCTSGNRKVLRIGCALLPKKVSRYLTKSMQRIASSRGVELVLLDHTKPLVDQGEYDAIVHKLRPNKDWERNLHEYITARPGVKVIDSLAGIRIVHNRATMLLPLREHPDGITLQKPYSRNGRGGYNIARIQSPTQVEITEGMSLAEAQTRLRLAGLTPPLLVKPLWTDGREGSHGLAVLHDMAAMGKVLQGGVSSSLKPPLVVQQFVDHGGVLFKVYVLGVRTVVCLRPSLGDSHLGREERRAGVQSLPRISCKSSYAKGSPEDKLSAGIIYDTAAAGGRFSSPSDFDCGSDGVRGSGRLESWGRVHQGAVSAPDLSPQRPPPEQLLHPSAPPEWVTSALAGTLRDKLGLQLFNFDMICPADQPSPHERLYYVVDINYFPGVDKIPDFEHIFVDFLTATCEGDLECGGDRALAPADAGQTDTEMAGGEDAVSSVSSDKGDVGRLLMVGADAPAPAAPPPAPAGTTTWGPLEQHS